MIINLTIRVGMYDLVYINDTKKQFTKSLLLPVTNLIVPTGTGSNTTIYICCAVFTCKTRLQMCGLSESYILM